MRVVFDTNVIISAAIAKRASTPAQVLMLWENQQFTLVISDAILAEYKKALTYPHIQQLHKKTPAQVNTLISKFRKTALVVNPKKEETIARDPKDNMFLSCAIASKAEYIISDDRDLLDIREHKGIRIFTPSMFLILLQQEKTV